MTGQAIVEVVFLLFDSEFTDRSHNASADLLLRYGFPITCTSFKKDASGEVEEVLAEYDPDFAGKKVPKVRSCIVAGSRLIVLGHSILAARKCLLHGPHFSHLKAHDLRAHELNR